MTAPAQQQFQIYLPGLLRVLAESLYSSGNVAIRELLQNAHDSTIRRRIEHPDPHYQPRIDVTLDREQSILRIRDNGSGLTAEEIDTYLSTIGRSYTRQLNDDLAVFSPQQAETLIGQFGLGFLSAFLVASEVRLMTHAVTPDSPTIEWRSTGDIHYTTRVIEPQPVGTTVELVLKPAASHLLDQEVLRRQVRTYADFLDVPIYLSGQSEPVNTRTPPWERPETLERYLTQQLGEPPPLCLIPLHDQLLPAGEDQLLVPLRGFLYVPSTSVVSILEYGDLTVFIRRMFVCVDQGELLPAWARFVRGMVDSPLLQPTASREQIQHDTGFDLVRQALAHQFTEGLQRIAHDDPFTWGQIVRGHRNVILGWAVKADALFEHVADLIPFRTTRGLLTLPEVLALAGSTLEYTTDTSGGLQKQLIHEGDERPVIDAASYVEPGFLRKYAERHPDITLVHLEERQMLPADTGDPGVFAPLVAYYEAQGIASRVTRFQPVEVPAVMTYPADAEFFQETHAMLDAGELPPTYSNLVADYLDRIEPQALTGTLCLNADNPLLRALAASTDPAARAAALQAILLAARLLNGRMLTVSDAIGLYHRANAAWLTLLEGR